jgi:D123
MTEVDLRSRAAGERPAYASVEYVSARSDAINDNNLQKSEDPEVRAAASVFRVVEADTGEISTAVPRGVDPGAAQCDLCFRKFATFSDVFKHKAAPCVADAESALFGQSHVVRVVFPETELPFIADALRALRKDPAPFSGPSAGEDSSLPSRPELFVEHEAELVPLLLRQLYVAHITKFDVEEWYPSVADAGVTQRSFMVPLSNEDLKLIQSLASTHLAENLGMARRLTNAELAAREELEARLQAAIDAEREHFPSGNFFIRLSTRSPKDGVSLTKEQRASMTASERLRAKLQLMKVCTGEEALGLLVRSQRIFTDITMHGQYTLGSGVSGNQMSVIFREFSEEMSPDMEFRCYVVGRRLCAVSQYHCYMRLEDSHPLFDPNYAEAVRDSIVAFHDKRFASLLPETLRDYVVDIAVDRDNVSPDGCSVVEL